MTTQSMPNVHKRADQPPVSRLAQYARVLYLILAVLFVGGVIAQVFFIGATLLTSSEYLNLHRSVGDALARLPVFMVLMSILARLPRRLFLFSVLLFVLFVMQFILIHAFPALTPVRALHAVNALALFWLALHLVKSTWRLLRASAL